MRSGRLFGVVVGMAGFPFVGCDLSGDEVGVRGGVFDLAPDVLWDVGVAIDEFEPSFDVFEVVDGFGVGDLVHDYLQVMVNVDTHGLWCRPRRKSALRRFMRVLLW